MVARGRALTLCAVLRPAAAPSVRGERTARPPCPPVFVHLVFSRAELARPLTRYQPAAAPQPAPPAPVSIDIPRIGERRGWVDPFH